ncbi:MAG: hypothetical protein AB7K71_04380 [Polyangiaceae bacterium]
MTEANFDEEVPFQDHPALAAAVICRTDEGNLHTGILHKSDVSPEVQVLHLGWQNYVSDAWEWCRLWAAPDEEPEVLRAVSGVCRLVWSTFQQTRKFPYGLGLDGVRFDGSGALILEGSAKGLTCATFVLAVFARVGIDLVDVATWPRRIDEDLAWLDSLEVFLGPRQRPVLDRLREETKAGQIRIRPHEVVGACALDSPAPFEHAAAAGAVVLGRLA